MSCFINENIQINNIYTIETEYGEKTGTVNAYNDNDYHNWYLTMVFKYSSSGELLWVHTTDPSLQYPAGGVVNGGSVLISYWDRIIISKFKVPNNII